jgi:alanine dehydrogenase
VADQNRLRYLSRADVEACLPDAARQLDLARRALEALASGGAEMPPKVGVHPRPGALLHAMPAWVHDRDLVGMKWVSAYPGNTARRVPAIQGVIVVNDADTGTPRAVMDAAIITAARTAAVSGLAVTVLAQTAVARIAIIGSGTQARSHVRLLADVIPGTEIVAYDRHPERASEFADFASRLPGVERARAAETARAAVDGADVVITGGAITNAQQMTPDWLTAPALVIAVDFAAHVSAQLAAEAGAFVVDDRTQFEAYRAAGYFDGYPEPTATLGELASPGTARTGKRANGAPAKAHTVVTHLGVGIADVLFADEVLRTAEVRGVGTLLER